MRHATSLPRISKLHRAAILAPVRAPIAFKTDCSACNGSGIRALCCDSFTGAHLIPCERCGAERPAMLQDKAFLMQVAASTTIAGATLAWIMLFA